MGSGAVVMRNMREKASTPEGQAELSAIGDGLAGFFAATLLLPIFGPIYATKGVMRLYSAARKRAIIATQVKPIDLTGITFDYEVNFDPGISSYSEDNLYVNILDNSIISNDIKQATASGNNKVLLTLPFNTFKKQCNIVKIYRGSSVDNIDIWIQKFKNFTNAESQTEEEWWDIEEDFFNSKVFKQISNKCCEDIQDKCYEFEREDFDGDGVCVDSVAEYLISFLEKWKEIGYGGKAMLINGTNACFIRESDHEVKYDLEHDDELFYNSKLDNGVGWQYAYRDLKENQAIVYPSSAKFKPEMGKGVVVDKAEFYAKLNALKQA